MSKAGYHWSPREEKRPAPCFICGTEPRLEGHVVCSRDHDEARCPKCNPTAAFVVPVFQTRGVLTAEAESGREL